MWKFLHSSDLHLGRTFRQFPADLSAQLAEARLEVIGRLAHQARDAGASCVLLAGDTWDSETPSDRVLRQSVDRFAEHEDLKWILLPGNHDPIGAAGLWDRVASERPQNLMVLAEPGPHEVEPGVWLLAAPCLARPEPGDPTAWMSQSGTPDGAHRIGVAHGPVLSFVEDRSSTVIDNNRAKDAGLDYLALGDWHGWTQFGDRTIYPGTPEPDRFRDESGSAALVTIPDGDGAPEIVRCPVAQFSWRKRMINPAEEPDPTVALDRLVPEGVSRRDIILSLDIVGAIRPEEKAVWLQTIEDYGLSLRFLGVDQSELTNLVKAENLDLIDRQGALRAVADDLLAGSTDQDQSAESRAAASLALDLLFTWSAESAKTQ